MTSSKAENILKQWFPSITTPFIANAPMFGFADVGLATAVTRAGGLGFIGAGFDFGPESSQLQSLDAQLGKARSELGLADIGAPLLLGAGFITFKPAGFNENAIPILQKHRIAAIWLSFPQSDADHLSIIQAIREARTRETAATWNVRIFVQVGTVQAAKNAIQQGADILVVQGTDAGGHQWAQGASLMALLPEVRDSLRDSARPIGILAAGGVVDGRGCVAALSLGADGVVMGTRFIATTECPAPPSIKRTIISTNDGAVSTIKSIQHDVFQSTDVFPRQYDGRAVVGINYEEIQNGVSAEDVIKRYDEARKRGDDYRRTVWAGASLGVIKNVVSVDELIRKVQQEAKSVAKKIRGEL